MEELTLDSSNKYVLVDNIYLQGHYNDIRNGNYTIEINANGYYSATKDITITKGTIPFPSDLSISETKDGEIKIETTDLNYLNTLVSNLDGSNASNCVVVYDEITGLGPFFENTESNKPLVLDEPEGCVFIRPNYDLFANGEHRAIIRVRGYSSAEIYLTLSNCLNRMPDISITQTADDLILEFTGENANDVVSSIFEGNMYDYVNQVSTNSIYISLVLQNDNLATGFGGSILNGTTITSEGEEREEAFKKISETKLSVSKKEMREAGFYTGNYRMYFNVEGYLRSSVAFELDLGSDNIYPGNQQATKVVVSEPLEYCAGNYVSWQELNAKAYINEKETQIKRVSAAILTDDEKLVEGKEYDVEIWYTFIGSYDETVETVLEINGNEYLMAPNFRGVTGGTAGGINVGQDSIMSTIKIKAQKATELPKVTVPTTNTGLVYTGLELTGVNEGENYTVTGNKATDAGEYTATLKLNEGYMWSDGTTADKTITWSIDKATPEYTLPEDLTATHEDSLSDVTLPEGFAWKDATQVINGVGEKEYDAVFTPADTNNYKTVDVKVKVDVAPKKVESLVSPTAEDTVYGNKLSSVKLSLEGWAWKDGNIVPTVKNDGFEVVYVIDDDVNYDYSEIEGYNAESHSVTRKIDLTVEKAEVAVTVPEFKAVYGNTLDDIKNQLTEGWSFKEALTTSVGDAGVNKVTVIYTPKDTDNFKVSEKEAVLNVEKATPEYTVPTGLNATEGQKLSEVTLPDGWTWVDSETTVSDSNMALFTPADTKNYKTVTLALKVAIAREVEIGEDTKLSVSTEVGVTTENDNTTEQLVVKNDALTNSVIDLVTSTADGSESKTTIEDIKENEDSKTVSEVLTDAVDAMNDGWDVQIETSTTVNKEELKEEDLSDETMLLISEKLSVASKVLSYMDLTVTLEVTTSFSDYLETAKAEVKELAEPLKVSIKVELPDDVVAKDYKFYVVTVHEQDGVITTDTIEATYDEATGTVNFYAQEFSYYTIAYEKLPTNNNNNNNTTSSNNNGGYRAPNTFAGY